MCPTILEVSFICLLGIAVIGKIGRHVRFLPQKKKKKKGLDRALPGCHPRWRVNEAGAEAGEGQSYQMCCCCGGVRERHEEPAVKEGLPGYVLRLQQVADDLGLEWARMSTKAMPPRGTALLETPLLGGWYAAPATTGRLAATKMYTAVQSCLSCFVTGMTVP